MGMHCFWNQQFSNIQPSEHHKDRSERELDNCKQVLVYAFKFHELHQDFSASSISTHPA